MNAQCRRVRDKLVCCPSSDATCADSIIGIGLPAFRDGSISSAAFQWPSSIAIPSSGSVGFIADAANHRIRSFPLPCSAQQITLPDPLSGTCHLLTVAPSGSASLLGSEWSGAQSNAQTPTVQTWVLSAGMGAQARSQVKVALTRFVPSEDALLEAFSCIPDADLRYCQSMTSITGFALTQSELHAFRAPPGLLLVLSFSFSTLVGSQGVQFLWDIVNDADGECGDMLVDAAAGEGCDDGNGSDLDGCSSTCVREDLHACSAPYNGLFGPQKCYKCIVPQVSHPCSSCPESSPPPRVPESQSPHPTMIVLAMQSLTQALIIGWCWCGFQNATANATMLDSVGCPAWTCDQGLFQSSVFACSPCAAAICPVGMYPSACKADGVSCETCTNRVGYSLFTSPGQFDLDYLDLYPGSMMTIGRRSSASAMQPPSEI